MGPKTKSQRCIKALGVSPLYPLYYGHGSTLGFIRLSKPMKSKKRLLNAFFCIPPVDSH